MTQRYYQCTGLFRKLSTYLWSLLSGNKWITLWQTIDKFWFLAIDGDAWSTDCLLWAQVTRLFGVSLLACTLDLCLFGNYGRGLDDETCLFPFCFSNNLGCWWKLILDDEGWRLEEKWVREKWDENEIYEW